MHRRQRVPASGLSSRSPILATVALPARSATARADVTLKEKTDHSGLAGF